MTDLIFPLFSLAISISTLIFITNIYNVHNDEKTSKQKFAWLPTEVWNMKTSNYRYTTLWLCWYWEDNNGEPDKPSGFHRLSDDQYEDTRMWQRNKTRMNSNRW